MLAVARVGRVEETGDPLLPFRLLDEQGAEVPAVTEFLHHMLADDASAASFRSYAYELLPWFRFLGAVMVPWDLAGRAEARDFALWLKTVKKPARQRRSRVRISCCADGGIHRIGARRWISCFVRRTDVRARSASLRRGCQP